MSGDLLVIDAGLATTIQDHGRPGRAHLGVPGAGAVDRRSHDLANRLVGNPQSAATIETRGALTVQALRPLVVATSGHRITLGSGEVTRVDPAEGEMWAYLAVRGGLSVEPVLGSRSHDTLAGLGPPMIASRTELPVGADPGTDLPADHAPRRERGRTVRIWRGPRADRFDGGLELLVERTWEVSSAVSRVGVRLAQGDFVMSSERLASEGLVEGAMQITPSGEPIIMLANHPTTGGYLVIGVVDPDDIDVVAQSLPGASLRFVLVNGA